MRSTILTAALLLLAVVAPAQGKVTDTLVLDNGDKIQGQLLTITGGKVKFKTDWAPALVIPLARVSSLTSGGEVDLVFKDGRKVKGRLLIGTDSTGGGQGVYAFSKYADSGLKVVNPAPPPVYRWEGSIAGGYTAARGNTRSDSISLQAEASRRWEKSRLTLDGSWFYQRAYDDVARDYQLGQRQVRGGAKYDYFVSKKFFAYGSTRAERDDLQDLDFRYQAGAGAGYQFIEDPELKLSGEAGLGYDKREFDHDAGTEENTVLRIADSLKVDLGKGFEFIHKGELLTTTTGSREHTATIDFGLRAALTESFFAQVQANYRWETDPAPGAKRLDSLYILSVGWKF